MIWIEKNRQGPGTQPLMMVLPPPAGCSWFSNLWLALWYNYWLLTPHLEYSIEAAKPHCSLAVRRRGYAYGIKMICVPLQIVYNLGNCLKRLSWLGSKDSWIYRPSSRKVTLGQILHAVSPPQLYSFLRLHLCCFGVRENEMKHGCENEWRNARALLWCGNGSEFCLIVIIILAHISASR